MLEIISGGFKKAKEALTGTATLTEANIDDAMRAIRTSLLEADVETGVVKAFLGRVKERALGEVVPLSINGDGKKKQRATPGEHFTLICHHELEKLMGTAESSPFVYKRPMTTIMMVGLQGTGKTTTCGKLASYLLAQKRRPMLVAADIYRPAAVEQLKTLGKRLGVPVYAAPDLAPPQLCFDALREAKKRKRDVVIFDTAGRLAIDEVLMTELDDIVTRTKPDYTLLVCDAMAGQDTVTTASAFNRRLNISGFVMTKLDGDARGGAALSIREVTGKPIKFLGTGEDLDKLEPFRPEGLASRILGMGDVVGLMRDFEQHIDEREAERDTKKLLKGQFTLDDFLKQLRMLKKVGSLSDIYEKFPIFGENGAPGGAQVDDKSLVIMESIIQSMTPDERTQPGIVDASRMERIARGSGRKKEAVRDLLGRFQMMHTMMANLAASPGLLGALPGFKQLGQLRRSKGQGGPGGLSDLLGGLGGLPKSMRNMTRGLGGSPGMMPDFAGMGMGGPGGEMALDASSPSTAFPPAGMLPPGMTPESYAAALKAQRGLVPGPRREITSKEKAKIKDKRKQAKQARKRGRK